MKELVTSEMEYNGGLFPKIPDRVNGQDTLLVNSENIARKVDDYITTKDIRNGKYNRVVRISTVAYSLDVSLKAISKNSPYEFKITIGVEYRVKDSVAYYMNRNSEDVSDSIIKALSRIVTPISKQYGLIDSEIDHALLEKLAGCEYSIEALGITYSVLSVNAEPTDSALGFVKQLTDTTLIANIEKHKAEEAEKLTNQDLETAVFADVASGKITTREAIETLNNMRREEGHKKIEDMQLVANFIRELQEKNMISDSSMEQQIQGLLQSLPSNISGRRTLSGTGVQQIERKNNGADATLEELLPNDESGASE